MKLKHSQPTLASIARALKIGVRRVSQLRAAGMPVHSVAAAEKWRAERNAGDGENSPEALRAERILLVAAQRRRCEMENDIRAGKLLEADQVQQSIMHTMGAARLALTKTLLDEMPAKLEGLTASAIAKELKKVLLAILTQLSTAPFYDSDEVKAIVEGAKREAVKGN